MPFGTHVPWLSIHIFLLKHPHMQLRACVARFMRGSRVCMRALRAYVCMDRLVSVVTCCSVDGSVLDVGDPACCCHAELHVPINNCNPLSRPPPHIQHTGGIDGKTNASSGARL